MITPEISWFEKHRPQTIDDMVFDDESDRILAKEWIQNGSINGNVILFGPPGTGKTTLIEILIKNIVKAKNDLFRMKTRSVDEIDNRLKPFLNKRPVKSKIKIIYIEEIDGISPQGQRTLKEDCLEKYQKSCSFLCATNYIKKVDNALLTRFTYKISLNSNNIEGIKNRLKDILIKEECRFDENKLLEFVQKHYKKGLRDLINAIQIESIKTNKQLTFENSESSLNLEGNVVVLIFNIIKTVLQTRDLNERRNFMILPLNTKIGKDYEQLVTILHNNYNIDYDSVYDMLIENNNYLPLQVILSKYSETTDTKKFPHLHLISCLYEMIECCSKIIP